MHSILHISYNFIRFHAFSFGFYSDVLHILWVEILVAHECFMLLYQHVDLFASSVRASRKSAVRSNQLYFLFAFFVHVFISFLLQNPLIFFIYSLCDLLAVSLVFIYWILGFFISFTSLGHCISSRPATVTKSIRIGCCQARWQTRAMKVHFANEFVHFRPFN